MQSCPTSERWQAHLDGVLSAADQATLTEHLDGCASCQRILDQLAAGGDSLLALAQQVGAEARGGDLTDGDVPVSTPGETTRAEPGRADDDGLPFLAPTQRADSLGRLGHYEILATIGKGGFGIVLKAFDERLHRVVAIKVLAPAYANHGAARKRFIREAQTAAAVKNEHVVGIYDVEKDAQPPYLAMELVDGISLQEKIDRHGTLGVKEILRIGLQMAEGLAAAHKQGLVHRDIKPANILLENGVERVKITDFGLARAVDDASVTQSGVVAGTPMYMSPEQAEGLPIDHRSDLFSLGTVLYAMCTGHPPFRASGTHAVLKRVIDAAPRPIHEINNEIPDWLCEIIARLHAKKPDERFQTAKEVAELLGQRLADVQAGSGYPRRAQTPRPPSAAAAQPAAWPVWPIALVGILLVALAPVLLYLFRVQGVILLGGLAIGYVMVLYHWLRAGVAPSSPDSQPTLLPVALVALFILLVALVFLGLLYAKHGEMPFWTWGIGPVLILVLGEGLCGLWWYLRRRLVGVETVKSPAEAAKDPVAATGDAKTQTRSRQRWRTVAAVLAIVALGCVIVGSRTQWFRDWFGKLVVGDRATVVVQWREPPGSTPFKVVLQQQAPPGKERLFKGEIHELAGPNAATPVIPVVQKREDRRPGREFKSVTMLPLGSYWLRIYRDDKEIHSQLVKIGSTERVEFVVPDPLEASAGGALQGKWTVVSQEWQGKPLAPDQLVPWIEFKGDRFYRQVVGAKTVAEQQFRLNPQTTPKQIDLYPVDSNNAEGAGIYRLDGDTLTLCITDIKEPRPLQFKTFFPSRAVVTVCKRDKAEAGGKSPSEGWVQMFDGLGLAGWKTHPKEDGRVWNISFGVLSVSADSVTHLFSERDDYTDFHLRIEAMFIDNAQPATVGLRAPFAIEDWGGVRCVGTGLGRNASKVFFGEERNKLKLKEIPLKADSWFTQEWIVKGGNLVVKVNGEVVCSHDEPSNEFIKGRVVLGIPSRGIQFKKIEIKELPPEGPPGPNFALAFDGDDHVAIPSLIYDGKHPITLEAWVRVPKAPEREMHVLGNGAISFRLNKDGHWFATVQDVPGPFLAKSARYISSAEPVAANRLTHVALVVFDREARLYVNGQRQQTPGALRADPVASGSPFVIGVRASKAAGLGLVGQIDELRISRSARYDRDFTPDKRFVPDKNTLALYHFDEGQGDVLKDASGNKHDGQIVGAKWVRTDGTPATNDAQWVKLFNGKDLTGWSGDTNVWSWKNDALNGTKLLPGGAIQMHSLRHQTTFKDFELKFQASIDKPAGQAAVCVRGKAGMPIGPTKDVGSFSTDWGSPDKLTAAKNQVELKKALKNGFNDFTIQCVGKRVTVSVNGVTTIDQEFADLPAEGPLAFKLFQGTTVTPNVSIRNVEIRELSTEPHWVQLFNGKDLTGWTPHDKMPNGWKVENGILVGRSPESYFYSKAVGDKPIHLRAVTRINDGGAGAIVLHTDFGALYGCIAAINSTHRSRKTGHLYGTYANFMTDPGPGAKPPPKSGEWFTLELVSRNGLVSVKVNGETTSTIDIGGRFGGTNQVALYVGGEQSVIEFKSIEIKELPAK